MPMKTKATDLLLLSVSILLLEGCSKDQSKEYASCEQQAYMQVGVQSDETASTDYSLKKYELVRVCMVKNGYSFLASQYQLEYDQRTKYIHEKYGTWSVPRRDPAHQEQFRRAENEIAHWDAVNRYAFRFWK